MKTTALLMCLFCIGCGEFVDPTNAVRTLEAEGWKDIHVIAQHGVSPSLVGGCSDNDSVAFETTGVNPAGEHSTATVCCGLVFKSCTIRH